MSDSDSDDDLLDNAVFARKRPSRKETATANKRLNMLDSLLDQQDERINKQTRMNEIIQKQKRGYVPNAKERIDSLEELMGSVAGSGGGSSRGSGQKRAGNESEGTTPPLDNPKNIYDFNDPSYWSKVDAMKQTGAQGLHERRRQIENEINGFYMNDEFGEPPDGSRGQTEEERERRMAEIAGRHSNIGTRQTLGWSKHQSVFVGDSDVCWKERSPLAPFTSLKDGTDSLVKIFRTYDCMPKRNLTADERKQWNGIRFKVIQPMKQADGMGILPQMLSRHWKPDLEIPEDLLAWLVRVATTGMMVMGTELCAGAFAMATTIFENKMPVLRYEMGKIETISEVLDAADFIPMLQSNYGLRKIRCDFESSLEPASPTIELVDTMENPKFEEPSGLEYAFKIWTIAIDKCMVNFDRKDGGKHNLLSQAVVNVLGCGLDPIFYAGHSLLECQGQLLKSLIEHIYNDVNEHNSKNGGLDFIEWVDTTAALVIGTCCEELSILPPTDEEDTDDDGGWLAMELLVRSWQTVQKHKSVNIFYSSLCNVALEKLAENLCNWSTEVERAAFTIVKTVHKSVDSEGKLKDFMHLRYRTIARAETALGMLMKVDCLNEEGPHFLATIRIAALCEQVGMELFMSNIREALTVSRNRGFCESDSEAAMLYEHFNHMCDICQHLKKKIRVVLNPYMRRSKELVLLLYSFYDKCKLKVSSWDKGRKNENVGSQVYHLFLTKMRMRRKTIEEINA